jgi:hypothetical protein
LLLPRKWAFISTGIVSEHAVILVVEDREDDIFLVRRAFQKAQVPNPIHVVRDGEEAIMLKANIRAALNILFPT